ncbi:MAG: hypothetical protein INR71_03515 [Terriglobus roseus]|nr:hypothetical protein [Terriglobus roseus]
MEGQYAQHPHQYGGPSPFFYYHPEAQQEARPQGHFAPQPQNVRYVHQDQYMHHEQMMPLYAPSMQYQKPHASQQYQQMAAYSPQPLMTPVASPQPLIQKPTILVQQESPYLFPLDTDCYTPSTPPLSSSGSAISSPPSTCDILPTPVHSFSQGECLEGVKQGCEEEVYSEILAGGQFTGPASPAMTPG